MATILFGGSFDPIHNGHLAMAKAALHHLPQATLLLIPAACSPFKTDRAMTDEAHRLAMCRLAAKEDPRIAVTDMEFYMEKPSYTVRTVEALLQKKPDDYYFLCGADAFLSLHRWKEYHKLIGMVTFLAVDRSGALPEQMLWQKQAIEQDGGQVVLLTMEQIPVSSTQIRQAIAENQSVHTMVPPLVARYLLENHLYKE